jgi:hypothetical protein
VIAAGMVVSKFLMIDAELVQQSGLIIVRRDDILDGPMAKLIGLSERHAASETAAGEPDAESLPVMIATGIFV